jgi:hypothetical protein
MNEICQGDLASVGAWPRRPSKSGSMPLPDRLRLALMLSITYPRYEESPDRAVALTAVSLPGEMAGRATGQHGSVQLRRGVKHELSSDP